MVNGEKRSVLFGCVEAAVDFCIPTHAFQLPPSSHLPFTFSSPPSLNGCPFNNYGPRSCGSLAIRCHVGTSVAFRLPFHSICPLVDLYIRHLFIFKLIQPTLLLSTSFFSSVTTGGKASGKGTLVAHDNRRSPATFKWQTQLTFKMATCTVHCTPPHFANDNQTPPSLSLLTTLFAQSHRQSHHFRPLLL
jgi:hypothetical protein